jgi:hypothetical protein
MARQQCQNRENNQKYEALLEQPQRDALQQFLTVFTSIQDQPITAGSRQSAVS